MTGTVSVLVPAYRSGEALQVTLRSLAAQTYPQVRVLVSFDHAPGYTLPAPPPMGHVDLEIIQLATRHGWVGNVNAMLDRVDTPYFVIVSHDDALTPTYIDAAMATLAARPDVVGAHGSVRLHGAREGIQTTEDITGDRLARVETFLDRGPVSAHMAWRSVHRRLVIDEGVRLRARRSEGLFADQLWALETLLIGPTANVPDVYYDKYLHGDGLVAAWRSWTAAEKAVGVADNIARTAEVIAAAGFPPDVQERILSAWALWLLGLQGDWNALADTRRSDALPLAEVRPALSRLIAMVALEGVVPTIGLSGPSTPTADGLATRLRARLRGLLRPLAGP